MKKRSIIAMTFMTCALAIGLMGCGGSASGDASADASADASGDPVKPEYDVNEYVTLGEYMGLEITATQYEATQDDYDTYLNDLLDSESYYAKSDKKKIEEGDTVNIDYVGTVDGEEFDGGSATGYELEIGSDTFIDGFEDQLVGVKVGKTVDVNVTFPDDYTNNTDLAGKDAVFTVTVNYILEDEVIFQKSEI